jgi:hypothetical protein
LAFLVRISAAPTANSVALSFTMIWVVKPIRAVSESHVLWSAYNFLHRHPVYIFDPLIPIIIFGHQT